MTHVPELARAYLGGLAHVHTKLSNYPGHFESDQTIGTLLTYLADEGLVGSLQAPLHYIMLNEHASNPTRPRLLGRLSRRARMLRRSQWLNHHLGVPVLHGFEASILPGGEIDLTPWLAELSKLVIASVHHAREPFASDPSKRTELLVAACANLDVDVLGHPMRGIDRPERIDWKRVFRAAAASGTAIEVNLNIFPSASAEPDRFQFWTAWLRLLEASGTGVFIGTDLHNRLQLQQFGTYWHDLPDLSRPNPLRDAVTALHEATIAPSRVVNAQYEPFCEWLARSKTGRRG